MLNRISIGDGKMNLRTEAACQKINAIASGSEIDDGIVMAWNSRLELASSTQRFRINATASWWSGNVALVDKLMYVQRRACTSACRLPVPSDEAENTHMCWACCFTAYQIHCCISISHADGAIMCDSYFQVSPIDNEPDRKCCT